MADDNLKASKPNRLITYMLLIGMAAFAIFFSLTIFAQTSLRLDEAQSLFQTNRDVGGVLYAVAQDVHVPFYHLLLHFWQLFFGNDIFTARMMSLVFFVGTIFLVYYLGTYVFRKRSIGLFAALLLTISPFMNWYGSEARMYAMLVFFVVLHQIFFVKLLRTPKPLFWVLFVVTAILGVYTHYFFGFVLLTEGLAFLLLRKNLPIKHGIIKLGLSAVAIVAALAPWILYVASLGAASNTQPLLGQPTAVDLFGTYMQFLFGFQVDAVNTFIISLWPILLLFAFFALKRKGMKLSNEVVLFIMTATIPIVGAFILSIAVKPLYESRYLIVSLPALILFVSWLLTQYRPAIAYAVRSALVILILILFGVQATNPRAPVQEDYSSAVAYLNEKASASDVIVLAAPFTVYPVEYYYDGPAKLTTQPIWDRFKEGSVPAFNEANVEKETNENVGAYQNAWVLLSYDQGYNEKLKKYYDGHFQRISEKTFSDGLVLYQYKIRYDPKITLAP